MHKFCGYYAVTQLGATGLMVGQRSELVITKSWNSSFVCTHRHLGETPHKGRWDRYWVESGLWIRSAYLGCSPPFSRQPHCENEVWLQTHEIASGDRFREAINQRWSWGPPEQNSFNLLVYNIFVSSFVLKSNVIEEKGAFPPTYVTPFHLLRAGDWLGPWRLHSCCLLSLL